MHAAAIQSKIWRGYGKAACVLGDEYKFYRLPGVLAPNKRFDTGLEYDNGLKYGQPGEKDYDGDKDWDRGQYDLSGAEDVVNPKRFDKPGARWDFGGRFDVADESLVDHTDWDASGQTFDSGNSWDQPGRFLLKRRVSLNAEDMRYSRPKKYGKPTWYALFDATAVTVSDYFIGPSGVFYVAALQPLLPILAVECNRVVNIYRPQRQTGTGLGGYGGTTDKNMTVLLKGRPCSILQGTKGEKSEASLPGDTRAAWWSILMPAAGGTIRPDDILIDDLQRRYAVSSAELTALGYRITAMQALS